MSTTVYGFVSWMASCAAFLLWFFWAFLPDSFLRGSLGFTYYPSKWWALAIPSYFLFSAWILVFAYQASFFIMAPALNDRILIEDEFSKKQKTESVKYEISNAVDLPLTKVNLIMFE
jgi:phosphatidylinositol N-acetylglucosaminyltransferase subunit P